MPFDPHSDTWRQVKEAAEITLRQSRRTIEQHGLDVAATEFERGRIKAAREILSLGEDRRPLEAAPTPMDYTIGGAGQ